MLFVNARVFVLQAVGTDLFPDPFLCSGALGCCELDTYIPLQESAQSYCRLSWPLEPLLLPCRNEERTNTFQSL